MSELVGVDTHHVFQSLIIQRRYLDGDLFRVIGVVLPAWTNPGPYEGDDATDEPARLMGLPVTWGDQFGLIVEVPGLGVRGE